MIAPAAERRAVQLSFRTDSVLFMLLLIGVALIESALIFLPADTLGPIDEQLLLAAGKTF